MLAVVLIMSTVLCFNTRSCFAHLNKCLIMHSKRIVNFLLLHFIILFGVSYCYILCQSEIDSDRLIDSA